MARPKNTEARRKQIARGLISAMAQRGYDGASINSIAAAAGLTSGLVHYHFKNKQEILLFALDDLVGHHRQSLAEKMAESSGNPKAQLDAFIDFHLGLGTNADPDALACWILLSGEALRQENIRQAYELAVSQLINELIDVVERGIKKGHFTPVDSREAAAAIFAVIQGYYVLAVTVRPLVPRGSAARSVRQMARGLLLPQADEMK